MFTVAQGARGDDDTLERARHGDHGAFAALVREHQSMVFSLALGFFRNRATAEDVAQDVFLELFGQLDRIESGAHVKFWLRRVTSNRCIDRARSAAHRLEVGMDEVPERSNSAAEQGADPWRDEALRRLVTELPPAARAVMLLRYQEDLNVSEIATVLGMPLNTVKSHLRRSVAALRSRLFLGACR